MSFADVLRGWYGLGWRRAASRALGRSPRTISRWAANDRAPAWALRRFADPQRAMARWGDIDRLEALGHEQVTAAASDLKSAVTIASRLAQQRLAQMEFEPPRQLGRPRIHRQTLPSRTAAQPLLRDRAQHEPRG